MSKTASAHHWDITNRFELGWFHALEAGIGVYRFVVTPEGIIDDMGPAAREGLNWDDERCRGSFLDCLHADDRERIKTTLYRVSLRPESPLRIQLRLCDGDGRWRHLEGVAASGPEAESPTVQLDIWDVTKRKEEEASDHRQSRLLHLLTERSEEVVMVIGADDEFVFVSGSARPILGQSELTLQRYLDTIQAEDRKRLANALRACRANEGVARRVEYRVRRSDGEFLHVVSHIHNRLSDKGIRGIVLYTRDVTAQKRVDPLTALPNRLALVERIQAELDKPEPATFAVLLVRLDRFDYIVGGLGRELGDLLIVSLAHRLRELIGDNQIVARLEGDRFAILVTQLQEEGEASGIAADIQARIRRPLNLGSDREIAATASIGIALGPKRYRSSRGVLQAAETAVLTAKERGQETPTTFETGMFHGIASRLWIEHDLRHAIARQQLELHYQPIMNLRRQRLAGFEALIRWHHPEHGMVSPSSFIPIAEQTGLIKLIGEWVLGVACTQLATWKEMYPEACQGVVMNVNLSPAQLAPGLVEDVRHLIEGSGLKAHHIKLEVTETSLIADPAMAERTLHALRELGVRLALDDFGTGYSSLRHLHSYPFDTLKVDRKFITDLGNDDTDMSKDLALVRTILKLGESLKMDVVAEGIETLEQLRILHALDCGYGQGYLFAKPLPADKAAALFQKKG